MEKKKFSKFSLHIKSHDTKTIDDEPKNDLGKKKFN